MRARALLRCSAKHIGGNKQINKQTNKQNYKQTKLQTNKQTKLQTNKQTNLQTNILAVTNRKD